jgi:16S rRNA (adenine1518-N6/adenine1519-N6)-dimethyltransferase
VTYAHDIKIKKHYGQHFLRSTQVLQSMFDAVSLDEYSSVFEVGCGDGFLTREILRHSGKRLWVFEIDSEWSTFIKTTIPDERMHVFTENILDASFVEFEQYAPWTLLANLPYQITFPFLYLMQRNRHILKEAVVMVQEEVAQKIIKTGGRGYGYPALFLQHYFEWRLLDKVPPAAFYPAPKVYSRLLYFRPKKQIVAIEDEERFWKFIGACFKQPRRTLKNNLQQTHFDCRNISDKYLVLRGQQMSFEELLFVWKQVKNNV